MRTKVYTQKQKSPGLTLTVSLTYLVDMDKLLQKSTVAVRNISISLVGEFDKNKKKYYHEKTLFFPNIFTWKKLYLSFIILNY